ncbi:MAG: hypothetical protein WCJ97_12385 [Phycisphaerae bacterium]
MKYFIVAIVFVFATTVCLQGADIFNTPPTSQPSPNSVKNIAVEQATAIYQKANEQADENFQKQVKALQQEYMKKVEFAQKTYVSSLRLAQASETRKGKLDDALAIKNMADTVESSPLPDAPAVEGVKREAPVAQTGNPKGKGEQLDVPLVDEKALRKLFIVDRKWRIEIDGLRLMDYSTLNSVWQYAGDFTMQLACDHQGRGPLKLQMWGEEFETTMSGALMLKREGGQLTFVQPKQKDDVRILKDEFKDKPSALNLSQHGSGYSGPHTTLIKAMRINGKAVAIVEQPKPK